MEAVVERAVAAVGVAFERVALRIVAAAFANSTRLQCTSSGHRRGQHHLEPWVPCADGWR